MYFITYKNTLKNILRSGTFWLIFGVLIVVASHGAISGYYVGDDEPGVRVSYNDFVEVIANSGISTLALYVLPLVAIVVTIIVLNRDYGDDFFEIEKASGLPHLPYLAGRLTAITTVVTVCMAISHAVCLHLYIFTRGGVPKLTPTEYLWESIVRMLRFDFCVILPELLFYLTMTYLLGVFLKKGYTTAAVSCVLMLSYYYVSITYRYQYISRFMDQFFDYFSPLPGKLRLYFQLYDTENDQFAYQVFDLSTADAIIGIAFLVGSSILFSLISYFRIRKRTV